MKYILIFVVLTSSLRAWPQTQPYALLNQAWETQSVALFDSFFRQWEAASTPMPEDSMPNDTIRNIYGVYQAFFRPQDSTENWQFRSNWHIREYCKARYLLPQSRMYYGFSGKVNLDSLQIQYEILKIKNGSEGDWKYINRFEDFFEEDYDWPPSLLLDTLKDFRPRLKGTASRALYDQPTYEHALLRLLGDSVYTDTFPSYEALVIARQKQRFLAPFLYVLPGHDYGWHITSHPLAYSVVFDPAFRYAVVRCRVEYKSGWACYRKEGGQWRFVCASLPMTE